MDVQLTPAETASWTSNPDWKTGFLAGMKLVVANDVLVVRIYDNSSVLLATYARNQWQLV